MSFLRPVLATSVLAVAALSTAPAVAKECVGTDATARVCVYPEHLSIDADGGPSVDDCVNLGGGPGHCDVPVKATAPSAGTTGPLYDSACGACGTVVPLVGDAVALAADTVQGLRDYIRDTDCLPMSTSTQYATELRQVLGGQIADQLGYIRCV